MTVQRIMMNRHGLNTLPTHPSIPDAKLMIGAAEVLGFVPFVHQKKVLPAEAVPIVKATKDMSYEEFNEGIYSGSLEIDDFPTDSYYLGNPVEGV